MPCFFRPHPSSTKTSSFSSQLLPLYEGRRPLYTHLDVLQFAGFSRDHQGCFPEIQSSPKDMLVKRTDANLLPPSVSIIPQVPENLADSDTVTLVCIANKLSVSLADVKWTSDGTEVTSNVQTSDPVQDPDKTYSISSYLSLTGREWKADKVYVCTASQGTLSSTASQQVQYSKCSK
ncbi:IGLL1 protein, partial [Polypterus senegalus]